MEASHTTLYQMGYKLHQTCEAQELLRGQSLYSFEESQYIKMLAYISKTIHYNI